MDLEIGKKLRIARILANTTQKRLGELCGLTQQRIAQYENGYRSPRPETLMRIITVLYELSTKDGTVATPDPEMQQIYTSFTAFKNYMMNETGEEATNAAEQEMLEAYGQLNRRGQIKVIDFALELADDEKYRKE